MKKLTIVAFMFAFVLFAQVSLAQTAQAETTTTTTTSLTSLAETIKTLLAKVADLQTQLAKLRGDVQIALKAGLKEGMSDEDVKKIQELLASDKEIYPEGKVTGYYGNLTKEALKRFQQKHNLAVTGEIDVATKELLDEYLKERFGEKVPPGLFHAPGILKKLKDNLCSNSGKVNARGIFCKDFKHDDSDDEDEDSSNDDNDDGFDVEVEFDGKTTIEFTFENKDYKVVVNGAGESAVLGAVADELDVDKNDLDADLVDEILEEMDQAMDDVGDKSDAEDAISDAEDAIDDVQENIDAASAGYDVDKAQDLLDEADKLLDDAEEALDDGDFDEAEDLAEDALDKAEKADTAFKDAS